MASGTRPQLPNGFPPCQEVGVSSWWPRRPGGSEEVGAWVSVAQSSGHSRPPGHSGLGDSASIWGQWGPQEGEGVDSWGIPTRGHTEPRPLAHTDVLTHAHSRKRKGSLSKAASPLLATAQKPQEGLSLAGWCWTELALWTPTHGYRVTCWWRQQPLGACAGWGGSLLPGAGDQPAGAGPQALSCSPMLSPSSDAFPRPLYRCETEAQRGQVTFPKPPSRLVGLEKSWRPRLPAPKSQGRWHPPLWPVSSPGEWAHSDHLAELS